MAMVDVRIVRMAVAQRLVRVAVRVRLAGRRRRVMHVAMVRVMDMAVLVLHCLVEMLVLVVLCDVQRDANQHQRSRQAQP